MKQTMQSIVENVLGSILPFEKRSSEKQEENKMSTTTKFQEQTNFEFSQASLPGQKHFGQFISEPKLVKNAARTTSLKMLFNYIKIIFFQTIKQFRKHFKKHDILEDVMVRNWQVCLLFINIENSVVS